MYSNGEFNFTAWPSAAPGMGPGDMSVVLTDLDRLSIGGKPAPRVKEAPPARAGKGPSRSTWTDADWEALAARLPKPSEPQMRVREFILGQLDRRAGRPRPVEGGPRQAGWLHEDDLIAVRKSLG